MAKRAKKSAAGSAARSRKTEKAVAVKSATRARKPARKEPPRKAARRSAAEVAKLRKAILAGARKGKSAEAVAAELGISKAYVYALKNRG